MKYEMSHAEVNTKADARTVCKMFSHVLGSNYMMKDEDVLRVGTEWYITNLFWRASARHKPALAQRGRMARSRDENRRAFLGHFVACSVPRGHLHSTATSRQLPAPLASISLSIIRLLCFSHAAFHLIVLSLVISKLIKKIFIKVIMHKYLCIQCIRYQNFNETNK